MKDFRKEYEESVTTVHALIHSINGMTTKKEQQKEKHKF